MLKLSASKPISLSLLSAKSGSFYLYKLFIAQIYAGSEYTKYDVKLKDEFFEYGAHKMTNLLHASSHLFVQKFKQCIIDLPPFTGKRSKKITIDNIKEISTHKFTTELLNKFIYFSKNIVRIEILES